MICRYLWYFPKGCAWFCEHADWGVAGYFSVKNCRRCIGTRLFVRKVMCAVNCPMFGQEICGIMQACMVWYWVAQVTLHSKRSCQADQSVGGNSKYCNYYWGWNPRLILFSRKPFCCLIDIVCWYSIRSHPRLLEDPLLTSLRPSKVHILSYGEN